MKSYLFCNESLNLRQNILRILHLLIKLLVEFLVDCGYWYKLDIWFIFEFDFRNRIELFLKLIQWYEVVTIWLLNWAYCRRWQKLSISIFCLNFSVNIISSHEDIWTLSSKTFLRYTFCSLSWFSRSSCIWALFNLFVKSICQKIAGSL